MDIPQPAWPYAGQSVGDSFVVPGFRDQARIHRGEPLREQKPAADALRRQVLPRQTYRIAG